jgi:hypothetical protein
MAFKTRNSCPIDLKEPRPGPIRQFIDLLYGSMPADFESVHTLEEPASRRSYTDIAW